MVKADGSRCLVELTTWGKSAIAMGRVDDSQGKMREALGGGLACLSDGGVDRLGYGQSKPHGSRPIEEGVSYVAAGTAGNAWSVVEGSSLSVGPSLGQDDVIFGNGPRGCACMARQWAVLIESRDDSGREHAQLLACWSVNSVRVPGLGEKVAPRRALRDSGPGTFRYFGIRKKGTNSCRQCMALFDEVFRRPPSHRWRKG